MINAVILIIVAIVGGAICLGYIQIKTKSYVATFLKGNKFMLVCFSLVLLVGVLRIMKLI